MKEPLPQPSPPRSPWQRLYAAAHALRRRSYRGRQQRLPLPVLSVGNLHWGGAGKTPMVAAVGRHLLASGERPVVLSRGYGRRRTGTLVVSRGEGPLVGVEEGGDEPFLLAAEVSGLGVVVAADRFLAGRWAIEGPERLAPTLFLLDDGFSHLRLRRDLDLLVFPPEDTLAGSRLLPSGRLREPLAATRHADAAVLTGLDRLDAERTEWLASSLRPYGFDGPAFGATLEVRAVAADGLTLGEGGRVVLVSGVARPEGVARSAQALGLEIVTELRFRDHHRYPPRSLRRIRRLAREHDADVLTTSKDLPKLAGLGLPVHHLATRCHPEPSFFDWLDQRLAEVRESC